MRHFKRVTRRLPKQADCYNYCNCVDKYSCDYCQEQYNPPSDCLCDNGSPGK